jgi:diamine N-acetyltransferase
MITLQKIHSKNIFEVVKLSVNDQQKSFVAPNEVSILEAYAAINDGITALPFALYSDEVLVGFVMLGYGQTEPDDPEIAENSYVIWRFMIDKAFQGQGLGKEAFQVILAYIKTDPCKKNAEFCWLSYEPENIVAQKLYASFGFKENGEHAGDEVVAYLEL